MLLLHGHHMRQDAARPLAHPIYSLGFYEHFYHCSLDARSANTYYAMVLLLPGARRGELERKLCSDCNILKSTIDEVTEDATHGRGRVSKREMQHAHHAVSHKFTIAIGNKCSEFDWTPRSNRTE